MTDRDGQPIRQAKALPYCLEPTTASGIKDHRTLVNHFRSKLAGNGHGALFRGKDNLSVLLCKSDEEPDELERVQKFDEVVFKSIKQQVGSLKTISPGGFGYARRLVAWIHLYTFDRLYKRRGRLDNFRKQG